MPTTGPIDSAPARWQGLADGYFILPYTIGHYLATTKCGPVGTGHPDVRAAEERVTNRIARLLRGRGRQTAASYHRSLGRLMWDLCGMAREEAGLKKALGAIPALREEFWHEVAVLGSGATFNQALEYAGRGG